MSYTSPFTGDVVQPTDVSYESITLTANLQLVWPINGNTAGDTPAARIMEVAASSAGLELRMPPGNQVSVGQDALIKNTGSETFTVKTYNGNGTIVSLPAGTARYIYLTDNGNTYGTWANVEFGAGTSAADAATLAGAGLLASGATLNQSHPTSSIAASYTFISSDRAKTYIWSGGATSCTLPAASVVGDNWFLLIKNNGTGTLTVNGAGSDLIDGNVSKAFQPAESAFVICTGTAFVTVGFGTSTNFEFGILTKTVSGGTDTLTAVEASNVIQLYTGALGSPEIVVFPPVVNLYVISNQCTGNTFTVTTGIGGSASVTVPSNSQATLICDGTNFLNANTTIAGATSLSIISGTVGAPAINFLAETNTGIYRPGAGRFGLSILGVSRFDLSATGLSIVGTGTFSGGVSGGTFT
jgi:hypothetical protein